MTQLTRTKYRKSVVLPAPDRLRTILKPGSNNAKLGSSVRKGMWKGLPIFSITLEERRTCPTTCQQWDNCYGNNMPFAHRFDHTSAVFLPQLHSELARALERHPQGIVVRLHVLGDFYSKTYLQFWENALYKRPGLRVFGYTHHPANSPLGKRIAKLNRDYPKRWRVRFSDDPNTEFRAEVVASAQQAPGVVCPEQLGKTKSCGTCAYCWHSEKPVYFLEH